MDDEEMVFIAMINSYNLIIKDVYLDAVDENDYFAHHVDEPVPKNALKNMLEYFTEIEHYEKCHNIKKVLANWTTNKHRKI